MRRSTLEKNDYLIFFSSREYSLELFLLAQTIAIKQLKVHLNGVSLQVGTPWCDLTEATVRFVGQSNKK